MEIVTKHCKPSKVYPRGRRRYGTLYAAFQVPYEAVVPAVNK
jgi:hypothetical protein